MLVVNVSALEEDKLVVMDEIISTFQQVLLELSFT